MFKLTIDAAPTEAAATFRGHRGLVRGTGEIGRAKAQVCVTADTREEAEVVARVQLLRYGWRVISVKDVLELEPLRISDLDDETAALYQTALRSGVAIRLVGSG